MTRCTINTIALSDQASLTQTFSKARCFSASCLSVVLRISVFGRRLLCLLFLGIHGRIPLGMSRQPIQIPVRYVRPRAIRKADAVQAWQALFVVVLCLTGGFILAQILQSERTSSSATGYSIAQTVCSLSFETGEEITHLTAKQQISLVSFNSMYEANSTESVTPIPQADTPFTAELPLCIADTASLQQSEDLVTNSDEENFLEQTESTATACKQIATSKSPLKKARPAPSSAQKAHGKMIATKNVNADTRRTGVRYREASKPPYPISLRMNRSEGSVHVRIFVNAQGDPTAVDILSGSGFTEMDTSAQTWIMRHWKFYPETINGEAVASVVSTHIHFKLN